MVKGEAAPPHPVQLVRVSAVNVSCQRRKRRAADPGEANAFLGAPRLASFSPGGALFDCDFQARLIVPTGDDEVWEARLHIRGEFSSAVQLKRTQAAFFAGTSALFVMLPIARADLIQLASLANVQAPTLPLVVRPPQQVDDRSDRP